jgi:linearmycin/streptolysin S transport system permease protein
MKAFDIAIKDMTRSFRSAFALIFMFGVPLLMTGMFSLMFGGSGSKNQAFTLPVTKVVVANLDESGPGFEVVKTQLPGGSQAGSMGDLILSVLQDKSFADLMQVTTVESAEAARKAVDSQKAGAAIIIPADFSDRFVDLEGQATLELYKDPALTIGPGIIQSIMEQFMDSMSAAKIAVSVTLKQTGSTDPALIGRVMQQYLSYAPAGDQRAALLDVRSVTTNKQSTSLLLTIIAPIMGWLTIFFAFFTGASTAQSILKEDEEGTLPRLFTTPTSQTTILAGKFLAVGLTVVVQMTVLLILGRLIFGIAWGTLLPVSLVTIGTILTAATFGIFLNSLLKSTKQSGLVFGGLLTVIGMLAGIPIFARGSSAADTFSTISLLVPPGWAVRGLLQTMNSAPLQDILVTFLALTAWSIVLFVVGVLRFQNRYARRNHVTHS